MKTNNQTGRNYVIIVGIYLLVKTVLNMFLGGGFDFGGIIFALVAAVAMFSGLQYLNIAVAAILALTVVQHLPYNLMHLPFTALYLVEAFIDACAVVLLLVHNDVKQHFTNKWSELSELFKGN